MTHALADELRDLRAHAINCQREYRLAAARHSAVLRSGGDEVPAIGEMKSRADLLADAVDRLAIAIAGAAGELDRYHRTISGVIDERLKIESVCDRLEQELREAKEAAE